jgi:hypothetical protein
MTIERDKQPLAAPQPLRTGARNMREPLRFTGVENLAGFAAEAALEGQQVGLLTRLALTSDEPLFHELVESLAGGIHYMAKQSGKTVDLRGVDLLLLVLKADATAELWLDAAAVSMEVVVKRSIQAGTFVFEEDIADIRRMSFPGVTLDPTDKVLCVFRQDWRFGFAFDMNPEGALDVNRFTTSLGSLCRAMRYRHLYDALGQPALFERLVTHGWFPFLEIIGTEFKDILSHCKAGFDLEQIEQNVIAGFDGPRTDRVLERWLAKPHFAARAELLKAAITAFRAGQPIPTIKILLTEIEGVLNAAHRAAHGKGARLRDLLTFAETSAERRAGGSDTLLFPREFGRYLRDYTFAAFDPASQTGGAGSRHAVGHGAASQESYTMARALQAILTLDQLAFYT